MNKISRRKLAVADVDSDIDILGADDEVKEIETAEESPGNMGDYAEQVRALIMRMADLSHYNAINDIDFIVEAIGRKDYAGSPALDVLPSYEGLDRRRRERIREYIHILSCWVEGKDVADAISEFKSDEKLLRSMYLYLGDLDGEKEDLALALIKSLKEKSASPEDIISEISDEEFIGSLYKTILGREPGEDDTRSRLMQLKRGKTRQALIKEILESRESNRRTLTIIAESIGEPGVS